MTMHKPVTSPRKRLIEKLGGFAVALFATLISAPAQSTVPIPTVPLFTISAGKPNVLLVLDNSNSMDESASGAAVGSNAADSKSEISRGVIKDIITDYSGKMNVGLMSYKQNNPTGYYLHNTPYDASFNPANYDPTFTGSRDSSTKRFRQPNPTSPAEYIYYNVALPFYAGSNQGNLFCYSSTANFDNGAEIYPGGPWDSYRCYNTKIGISDVLPATPVIATANGYSGFVGSYTFSPTDSDLAQNILDFGRFLTSSYVSRTWYRNDSPGRGHLDVPIKDLDAAQATALNAKLACNIPGNPGACTSAGLQNAGLTPIQGTLLTAKDYLNGNLTRADEGYTASCYPLPTTCKKNYVILLTDGLPSTDKNGNVVTDPAVAIDQARSAAAALKADDIETYVIGFALPFGVDPTTLNIVAGAGGTGTAYNASDSASLKAALDAIFQDIATKSGSGGAVATNSTTLTTDTRVIKATFTPGAWYGTLGSYGITNKVVDSAPTWTATIPAPGARKILTLDGTGNDVNFPSVSQLLALGPLTAAYIRGVRTGEGTVFRTRTSVLGDIIDSSPVYVEQGNFPTITKTIYVGANDGMLHAFDAVTGVEKFAYVPIGQDFAKLRTLSSPAYSHSYFVDGELAVSTEAQTPGKRILVGTLGRGGQSIFAIDITDPDNPDVLWEKNSTDAGFSNLGFALGKPVVAKLNTGVPGVMIGNGYNSTDEHSSVLVLNIETGALIKDLDTGVGSAMFSNGMATPRGWDADRNGTVDIIYAGDLLGNLWKLDVADSDPSSWESAFKAGSTWEPLFVAKDASNNRQPITGGLSIGLNPDTYERWVFFGTGRYLSATDPADKQVQTWYGMSDDGTQVSSRSDLKQRSITVESGGQRAFEKGLLGDLVGKRGWYVDLEPVAGVGIGERMVSDQGLLGSVLLAASIIPDNAICAAGGTGYINAIDAFKGTAVSSPFFDVSGDGYFDDDDKINDGTDDLAVGSVNLGVDMPTTPLVIESVLVAGGSSGGIGGIGVANPVTSGRISWRELIRN